MKCIIEKKERPAMRAKTKIFAEKEVYTTIIRKMGSNNLHER